MGAWDVAVAARRQLVVLLVGLLVAGWAAHAVTQEQPVYWARVRAVLVADGALRNWLLQPGESAIPLAGLLERRMNAEVDAVPTNSPDITIIVLEAAGPDETSVHEQMDGLIRRLRGELTTLQRDLLVASSPRVGFSDSTLEYTVQAAAGRPKVAALGVLFVGGTLTLLACVCVERLRGSAGNFTASRGPVPS